MRVAGPRGAGPHHGVLSLQGSQSAHAAAHGCRLATARLQPAGAGSPAAMHGAAGLTPGWESHACSSRGGCTRIRPGQWGVAASSTLELQARPGRAAHAPPPKIWRCPRPLLRRHPRRASRPSLEPGVRVATGLIDRVCIAATVNRAALSLRAACSYLTPVSPADTVVAARRHHRYHRCLIERLQRVLDLGGVVVVRVHYRPGRSVS